MQTRLFTFILLAMVMVYSSCSSDNPLNDNEGTGGNNGSSNLKTGQIQMKVSPNKYNIVRFVIVAESVIVNWGDGQVDELILNGIKKELKHEYLNKNLKTVFIKTNRMTEYLDSGPERSPILEMRWGDCPSLEKLSLDYQREMTVLDLGNCPLLKDWSIDHCNELTSLNIKSCPSVNYIECYANYSLSELELNKLFNVLPKTTDGIISCSSNLGSATCDISIAEKKGWSVHK